MKPNKLKQSLIKVSFLLVCSLFLLVVCQAQAWANGAGLVIKHGDGRVVTRYISFNESSISGLDLLKRSGLQVAIGGDGAVYQLDGEGDPNRWVIVGGKTYYWAYYHLKGSSWQYSNIGTASYQVKNGDVEGWAWGQGSIGQGNAPPVITFAQIAPPATTTASSPANSSSAGSSTASSSSQSANPASLPQATNQSSSSSGQEMSAAQTSDADQPDKHSSKKEEEKKPKKEGSFWQLVAFGITIFFLSGLIIVYRRRNSKKPKASKEAA